MTTENTAENSAAPLGAEQPSAARAAGQEEAGQFAMIYDGQPCDGVEPSGQKFAWHNFIVRKEADNDQEARLCVCITDDGKNEVELGPGDGGNWPDEWSQEIMDEFRHDALTIAREKTNWGSITREID